MGPYDLESASFFADPTPVLDRMRAEDPVHWHAPLEAWVLTRHDDVASVLRDPRFSVARGGAVARCPHVEVGPELEECNAFFGQWMVFSDPPRHGRLRFRVANAFTPARVRALRPWVEATAAEMVAECLRAEGPFDFVGRFAEPFPARVTARLLGVPEAALPQLQAWTDDFFAYFGAGHASARVVRLANLAMRECRRFFEKELTARRDAPLPDLLGALVAAEEADRQLDEEELLGVAMTLLAGAFGTTSHLISHALVALLERPEQLALLRREPALAAAAVEETLRFDGPALSLQRLALEPVMVGGRRVEAGQRVYCMLHAANHDPAVFADPSRFDLCRPPTPNLGLGVGRHFCLGSALTRMESEVALAAVVAACPTLRRVDPPQREGNMAMRGLRSLWVEAGSFGADTRPMPSPGPSP